MHTECIICPIYSDGSKELPCYVQLHAGYNILHFTTNVVAKSSCYIASTNTHRSDSAWVFDRYPNDVFLNLDP